MSDFGKSLLMSDVIQSLKCVFIFSNGDNVMSDVVVHPFYYEHPIEIHGLRRLLEVVASTPLTYRLLRVLRVELYPPQPTCANCHLSDFMAVVSSSSIYFYRELHFKTPGRYAHENCCGLAQSA
ncbi:hypothetical protein ANCCAN_06367 [Ancylostoma caninum]|uniref:Uncharacterized protein n=1 Tax=Ancylostoma caninum TaxID=29170 RepID=A0A368GTA1_ANCCA|nr:hypothetical protein ANCCAN_06367 [Ancylostoma caninum]